MNFYPKNIPQELRILKQWVVYKIKHTDNKTQKFMISPNTGTFAKSNDPSSWSDYTSAFRYMLNNHYDGMALVLTSGIVFVDIDHCFDDEGNISEFASSILNELPNTYAERSCSGKGLHILCYGNLPIYAYKRNDKLGLEMYDTKRFLCVTGDLVSNDNHLKDYSLLINDFNEKYMGKREINPIRKTSITFSDEELIQKIRASKIGAKFDELYSGDISSYPSHSNADFAFIRLLAFWSQDINQIDNIFRSSGLYRDKWDRRIGNSTYGAITIENAIASVSKTYSQREL